MDKIKKLLFAIMFIIVGIFFFSQNALGISSEEIFKRVLVNRVGGCYNWMFREQIQAREYVSFDSLIREGRGKSDSGSIIIPALNDSLNNIEEIDSEGRRVTNCCALFRGDASKAGGGPLDGTMKGLFEIYNIEVPESASDIQRLSNFMGEVLVYTIDTSKASNVQYCYRVYKKSNTTGVSDKLIGEHCRSEDSYPAKQVAWDFGADDDTKGNYTVTKAGNDEQIRVTWHLNLTCESGEVTGQACEYVHSVTTSKPKDDELNKQIELGLEASFGSSEEKPFYYTITKEETDSKDDSREVIYKKRGMGWENEVIKGVTKGAFDNRVAFTDGDKYDFYLQYLKRNYNRNQDVTINADSCLTEKPNQLVDKDNHRYYIYSSKDKGWCTVGLYSGENNTLNNSYVMTVFSEGERYELNDSVSTLSELINLMGTLDANAIDLAINQSSVSGEPSGNSENTCMNSGGAGSLGWIVCPVLEWLAEVSKDVYVEYVEPSLQIRPGLFNNDNSGEGAYQGWETFRNIANALFIILLLFVIFSQLTGIGIDNYGIKKVLPKLIISAVLINLSYVICQLCVDLSNILGNGFRSMFDSLGSSGDINFVITANEGSSEAIGVGATVLTSVVLLYAVVMGISALWANPAILISLLVSALGIFISIIFLFVLLAAREAAVVVLTVISPLAFACFILPNTKKLFDKWIKIGEGLLLVYPICGLLVGGGNYVSRLLLSTGYADSARSGSFITAFTAMIVGVVPIFFIPALLKGSFAAMGNLGAKISGVGDRLRRGATSGIRNTDRYKNLQQKGADRAKLKSLQRRAGGYVGKDNKFHERGIRGRIARTGVGRAFGMDRTMGQARGQFVQEQNARLDSISNLSNGVADAELQEAANARMRKEVKGDVGVAALERGHIYNDLMNERLKTDVEMELEPKPILDTDNLRIRTQNSINEAKADNMVLALPVDLPVAIQRRQSARDAQESKAALEEFNGMSDADLQTAINTSHGANGWYKPGTDHSSELRMAALLQSLESRGGREDDIIKIMDNNGANMISASAVKDTLARSSIYNLAAYGKKGVTGQTYDEFLIGANNGGTPGASLGEFIADNGVDKMDKDSLKDINKRIAAANATNNTALSQALSGVIGQDMLMEGAVNAKVPKVRDQMNQMIGERIKNMNSINDLNDFKFEEGYFASMNDDTAEVMLNSVRDWVQAKNPQLSQSQAEQHAKMALRSRFSNQINGAKSNNQTMAKISSSSKVHDIFFS